MNAFSQFINRPDFVYIYSAVVGPPLFAICVWINVVSRKAYRRNRI
jgi:hypothetical protein